MVTVRSVLFLAASRHWIIHQMDVYNAFLQVDHTEEVYMSLPQDFSKPGDTSLNFKIKDFGELKYFLGIEFARSVEGIFMHKRKYSLELIVDLGLSRAKPIASPMEPNLKLTSCEFDGHIGVIDDPHLDDPGPYQRLLGRLLYPDVIRPDISFAVQCLSHFMHKPKVSHMDAALRVVRYNKLCPRLGILHKSHCFKSLSAFCDADCVECPNSMKLVTCYIVKFGDSICDDPIGHLMF
ncbi:PREDICTED: uncharacterized protein LOC109242880 [Nicotiana attenuata]|uniref:uncharacterized protein LOC109242880 n=1 Tax=Nicotiana attenuata TaxID=49451 RepID=UPI0009059B64|nr:PREDICTED: uncharacterized protein LOC109242880 [Nicotiana attenuata]